MMTTFPDISHALPDRVIIETGSGTAELPGGEVITLDDVKITVKDGKISAAALFTGLRFITFIYRCEMPRGSRFLGDAWERGYGDLEWRGVVFDRVMPWYFFASDGGTLAGYGVKTKPAGMCSFSCDSRHVKLCVDLRCGGDAVELKGRELEICELVSAEYTAQTPEELFRGQRDFLRRLAKNPVFPAEPVYGFNNWYYAYGRSSRAEILSNCDHLRSLTRGNRVRPYMVIDDCWQRERPNGFIGGPWDQSNDAFGDMESLAREMASRDVRLGIWIRPLQDRSEKLTQDMYRDRTDFLLDPTRGDVLEYIAGTVDTICRWGYKLIKYDYTTNDITGRWGFQCGRDFCAGDVHFSDRSRTTAEIITELYKTIYNAADGRALILGCNTVGHLGVGFMECCRTGDDTSGNDFARTRRMGVNTLAFRMPQHDVFFAVDADCAGITKKIPWRLNEQWLSLLAESGTPLFVSVAPETPTKEQNGIIARCLKIASEARSVSVPLDVFETTTPERWLTADGIREYHMS